MDLPTRKQAMALLRSHTGNDNLLKHMIAVEAVMRAYARRFGEDEDLWGITGLLHDLDYEKHPTPQEHPAVGVRILGEAGYPGALVHAVKAHAPYLGVSRDTPLDKTLFAVDELTGFIVAVALMRPSRQLSDLKASSVRKKMKQKGFARNVNREDIEAGAEDLGVPLVEHLDFVIAAMRSVSDELGL